jgi:hypothetical protein
MKRLIFIIFVLIFITATTLASHADVIGTARLSLVQGDVVVQSRDTGPEWAVASVNLPLLPGDKLWVPDDARAEIQFLGGTYLRADRNTSLDITKLKRDEEGKVIQAAMPQGRIYVNYRGAAAGDSVFQVDTPFVSAMAYGRAKFDINVYENGYTEVSVTAGVVYVESQNGNSKVDAGNMISVRSDNYAELSTLRPRDEWVKWNLSRDSFLTGTRTSSRYLPPELDVYSSDFDENGRWVYTSDYGYVWRPLIAVNKWAPYRTGRWCWINSDYVWVSYEPWGWAPYHYGRWAFRGGIGWFWVPPAVNAAFWAPGFVAWIYTPTYVSWVPLAPGETYYGHGHHGPHSVNINKVNVKNINITNIYANARVSDSVTVINRETFVTGRPVKVSGAPANPFIEGIKVSPGRPEIKPGKTTSLPLPMRGVPQKSLPPKKIIETKETGKMSGRPVAVNRNESGFKTGKQVNPMPVNRIGYPKPVKPVQKPEVLIPQQKQKVDRPGANQRDDKKIPPVPKQGIGRDKMPKGQKDGPAVLPKEGAVTPPVKHKETNRPLPGEMNRREGTKHGDETQKLNMKDKQTDRDRKQQPSMVKTNIVAKERENIMNGKLKEIEPVYQGGKKERETVMLKKDKRPIDTSFLSGSSAIR